MVTFRLETSISPPSDTPRLLGAVKISSQLLWFSVFLLVDFPPVKQDNRVEEIGSCTVTVATLIFDLILAVEF